MDIIFEGKFKSLTSFDWRDIPKLAIITGVNGVGKTQFLNALYHKIQIPSTYSSLFPNTNLSIDKIHFNNGEIGFWESRGGIFLNETQKFDYIDVEQITQEIYRKIDSNAENNLKRLSPQSRFGIGIQLNESLIKHPVFKRSVANNLAKIIKSIEESTNKSRQDLLPEDILVNLPEDILLDGIDVINSDSIEMIFYLYQLKKAIGIQSGKNETDFSTPPWVILNDVLSTSGLPYIVTEPPIENIKAIVSNPINRVSCIPFSVKLINPSTNEDIGFSNLSGGERIIMSLAFLLYYSEKRNVSRKLLLLDEADAHLHPSMTKQFFKVIHETLILKYDARVILSTHSPSTLALAPRTPDCGVFEMKKEPTKFIKDESVNFSKSISILTDGLITVNPKSKYIFVEDEDDVDFYSNINSLVSISSDLIFIPASNRIENKNGSTVVHQSGGKDAVASWVSRFERFSNVFAGLIDKDNGNEIPEHTELNIINRYSIENYLIDPIVIFCVLNKSNSSAVNGLLGGFVVTKGTEHEIIYNDDIYLQKIVDHIILLVETKVLEDARLYLRDKLPEKEIDAKITAYKEKKEVQFFNGKKLMYPVWLFEHRGKNIYNVITRVTSVGNVINNPNLMPILNGLKMIPIELIDIINSCDK